MATIEAREGDVSLQGAEFSMLIKRRGYREIVSPSGSARVFVRRYGRNGALGIVEAASTQLLTEFFTGPKGLKRALLAGVELAVRRGVWR